MASRFERLHAPLITPLTLVLAVIAAAAAWFIYLRFQLGLGAIANINAGYPWGLWVVVDVVIGSALGCGGFAMALLIYIFNRGALSPLMRPALLGGLFGYSLAGAAVLFDLGRWWQFYNILTPWHWNLNSVMLEIALCVFVYVVVLWLEFSPALFERFGWKGLRQFAENWMWLLIALGVVLPFMHQSSLGSALVVLGHKLDPLYNTAFLPLLFVTSAIAMGFGVVVVEATVVSHSFRRASEHALLVQVAAVMAWLLIGWTLFRWGEVAYRGALGGVLAWSGATVSLWLETLLALFAALVCLSGARNDARWLFMAGVAVLLFGSVYRVASYLVAYHPVGNYSYFPSFPELVITIGVIAFEVLAYLVFVKVFPVLGAHGAAHPARK